MTGLPPRRFPAPPCVALGDKVRLRGNNVRNLRGGAREEGKKNPTAPSRGVAKAAADPPPPGATFPVPAVPGQRGAVRSGGREAGLPRVTSGGEITRAGAGPLQDVKCRFCSPLYARRERKEAYSDFEKAGGKVSCWASSCQPKLGESCWEGS